MFKKKKKKQPPPDWVWQEREPGYWVWKPRNGKRQYTAQRCKCGSKLQLYVSSRRPPSSMYHDDLDLGFAETMLQAMDRCSRVEEAIRGG